jgi:hypothetical protein
MQRRSCFITYNDRKITSKRKKAHGSNLLLMQFLGLRHQRRKKLKQKVSKLVNIQDLKRGLEKLSAALKLERLDMLALLAKKWMKKLTFLLDILPVVI